MRSALRCGRGYQAEDRVRKVDWIESGAEASANAVNTAGMMARGVPCAPKRPSRRTLQPTPGSEALARKVSAGVRAHLVKGFGWEDRKPGDRSTFVAAPGCGNCGLGRGPSPFVTHIRCPRRAGTRLRAGGRAAEGARRLTACEGEDALHLLVGEFEVEDVQVCSQMFLRGGFGDGGDLVLLD